MKLLEVFWVFLKLGLTSFGGPVAHLSYFHHEFVSRRRWIDERAYADLVALCQFLPGPASSQVGMALGFSRAGYLGALMAWIGFTLPSALILVLFALGISKWSDVLHFSYLHGLKVAAVAVVAQAIWTMGFKLCPDRPRISIALLVSVGAILIHSAFAQIAFIALGAAVGVIFLKKEQALPHVPSSIKSSRMPGFIFLFFFFGLLGLLPFLANQLNNLSLKQFDSFYRAGSLVFGGGHVVLPLLKNEIVNQGWVSNEMFMAGYGAAQAIPGPLFSFSAYLGAVSKVSPSPLSGAWLCLVATFLPSYLLILGVFPFWEKWRQHSKMQSAMKGINAVVVGLLMAAFYNPVWTSAIFNLRDFLLALLGFLLLQVYKTPSWAVVILSAIISSFI